MNETKSVKGISVRLEFISWASTFVGGDGNERKVFDEEVPEGATLRAVLKQMSRRYRSLDEALWHNGTDQLAEHLEIAVNDALLGIHHTLDSEMKEGDLVLLMGQYMGG